MTKLSTVLVVAGIGLLLFWTNFYLLWQSDVHPVSWSSLSTVASVWGQQHDELAERRLAQLPVHHLRGLSVLGQSTTSDKYFVYFVDGTRCLAKPIQEDNVFHFFVPLWRSTPLRVPVVASLSDDSAAAGRRESRWQYQGGPELLAHHVDRVVGWNKTAASVGRLIAHRAVREGHSLFDFVRYLFGYVLPDYDVPMALLPWYTAQFHQAPSAAGVDHELLTLRRPLPPDAGRWSRVWLLHLSDAFVFGYLVDDHDRAVEKNWLAALSPDAHPSVVELVQRRGGHDTAHFHSWAARSPQHDQRLVDAWSYLFWDSGLAFDHSPAAPPHACADILSGSEAWPTGERICLFRAATVARLRQLAAVADWVDQFGRRQRNSRLSQLLVARIAHSDPLAPIFHLLVYRTPDPASPLVRFDQQVFLDALDRRLVFLLDHIDACVQRHGAVRALLSDQQ